MTSDYPYGYERAEILSQSLNGVGATPDPKETYNIKVKGRSNFVSWHKALLFDKYILQNVTNSM
jgi:hypothetical protein